MALNVTVFDSRNVYVSPSPLHANAGVVSFVSVNSAGVKSVTLSCVSICRVRVSLEGPALRAWSYPLTRQ